ncbi:DUF3311 domain-containing protein [Streptomyces sp. NPDC001817]|uniref:DUF3311 domain-containing protein n=1 Tax=Streptomyces sp. NPDC001817 TaxID=3154398 RepID=UPI00331E7012
MPGFSWLRLRLSWLLVPYVIFLVPLPWINRIEPSVWGIPFFIFWLLCATLATPLAIAAAGLRGRR